MSITRRALLLGAAVVTGLPSLANAAEPVHISVMKRPGCTCCEGWAKHLREAGFTVSVVESEELDRIKEKLGVPADLRTCHTAEVDKYVLEGHVPAAAVRYLLHEKPERVTGLAVPGMPIGSPGMEAPGVTPEEYIVFLFSPTGRIAWAKFRGAIES